MKLDYSFLETSFIFDILIDYYTYVLFNFSFA